MNLDRNKQKKFVQIIGTDQSSFELESVIIDVNLSNLVYYNYFGYRLIPPKIQTVAHSSLIMLHITETCAIKARS